MKMSSSLLPSNDRIIEYKFQFPIPGTTPLSRTQSPFFLRLPRGHSPIGMSEFKFPANLSTFETFEKGEVIGMASLQNPSNPLTSSGGRSSLEEDGGLGPIQIGNEGTTQIGSELGQANFTGKRKNDEKNLWERTWSKEP